ncbi:MAG: ornithine carbamoyltransferase, partial [Patescibacteria group bacterium]
MKHFLSISDLTATQILDVLSLAQKLKKELKVKGGHQPILQNKSLVMLYEKPSLRTRLSFDIGINQLGGHAVYLSPNEIGIGTRESVGDVATVASRMGDVLVARTFEHSTIEEIAHHSLVPVINALSNREHPCQTLADLMTILEYKKNLKGLNIAFVGDGNNNVTHSLALAAGMLGLKLHVAAPIGYEMNKDITTQAKIYAQDSGGSITETVDPAEAVHSADVVYT